MRLDFCLDRGWGPGGSMAFRNHAEKILFLQANNFALHPLLRYPRSSDIAHLSVRQVKTTVSKLSKGQWSVKAF